MSFKYELLKKLVMAAGLKKRWLSVTTEELLEDRRKQKPICRDFTAFATSAPRRYRRARNAATIVCGSIRKRNEVAQ